MATLSSSSRPARAADVSTYTMVCDMSPPALLSSFKPWRWSTYAPGCRPERRGSRLGWSPIPPGSVSSLTHALDAGDPCASDGAPRGPSQAGDLVPESSYGSLG